MEFRDDRMYIKLREDVHQLVYANKPPHLGLTDHEKKFKRILWGIAGQWLEVETEYLFKDQFNTRDIRVMESWVSEIKNDARVGKMRCQYCGKSNPVNSACPNCGETKYLEIF